MAATNFCLDLNVGAAMITLPNVCDCSAESALVCKQHPDCRPSYCKLSFYEQSLENIVLFTPPRPPSPAVENTREQAAALERALIHRAMAARREVPTRKRWWHALWSKRR